MYHGFIKLDKSELFVKDLSDRPKGTKRHSTKLEKYTLILKK